MNSIALKKLPIRLYFQYMGVPCVRDCYGFSFSPARKVFYIRTLNSTGYAVTQSYNVSNLTNLQVAFNE